MDGFDAYSNLNVAPYNFAGGAMSLSNTTAFNSGKSFFYGGTLNGYMHKTSLLSVANPEMYCGFRFFTNNNGFLSVYVGFRDGVNISAALPTSGTFIGIFHTGIHITRGSVFLTGKQFTSSIRNTWNHFEFKSYAHSSTGWFKVRVNNSLFLEGNNFNTTNGSSYNGLALGFFDDNSSSKNLYLDDYFVFAGKPSGFWIGDSRVLTIYPTQGGGDFTGVPNTSPNTWTNIDENSTNTGNYNISATSGHKDLFGFSIPTGVSVSGVYGIKLNYYANRDNTEITYFRPIISGNSNIYSGDTNQLGLTYAFFNQIYENSPDSSLPWSQSEIENFKFGYSGIK